MQIFKPRSTLGCSYRGAAWFRTEAKIHAYDSTTSTILVGVPAFMAVWERLPYWNVLPPLLHSMPFALPAVDAAYAFWAKRRLGLTGRLRTLEQGSACNK